MKSLRELFGVKDPETIRKVLSGYGYHISPLGLVCDKNDILADIARRNSGLISERRVKISSNPYGKKIMPNQKKYSAYQAKIEELVTVLDNEGIKYAFIR